MSPHRAEGAFAFTLPGQRGDPLPLAAYAGRPLLIANTASRCGFTPQYAGLQRVWQQYGSPNDPGSGLMVIGVPSNDFGGQEPGTDAEIAGFCQANYGVGFPLSAKVPVRGRAAHPLFRFLAAQGGVLARPRWNFYKFLIGRDGNLAAWFTSLTPPDAPRLRRAIEAALKPTPAPEPPAKIAVP